MAYASDVSDEQDQQPNEWTGPRHPNGAPAYTGSPFLDLLLAQGGLSSPPPPDPAQHLDTSGYGTSYGDQAPTDAASFEAPASGAGTYFDPLPQTQDTEWGSPTPTRTPWATETALPDLPWGGSFADVAEAAGNPVTAARNAYGTQVARETHAAETPAEQARRTATAEAVGTTRASQTETAREVADAAKEATAQRREMGTATAQADKVMTAEAGTATRAAGEAAKTGTAEAIATAKEAAKEGTAQAATSTAEARMTQRAGETATAAAEPTSTRQPTNTPQPDPEKDVSEAGTLLEKANTLRKSWEKDPKTNEYIGPDPGAAMEEEANYLLNRARRSRGQPTYTPTPIVPTPSATATPAGPAAGLVAAVRSLFGGGSPEVGPAPALAWNNRAPLGEPDYLPATDVAPSSGADYASGVVAPPAPRTRNDVPRPGMAGFESGGPSDYLPPVVPPLPAPSPLDATWMGRNEAATPTPPLEITPAPVAPVTRTVPAARGGTRAPAQTQGAAATAPPAPSETASSATAGYGPIPPQVEQWRAVVEKHFGDLGPDAVDHALALMARESGGNAQAHNTQGEDSRGLMQVNVGAGGNTDLSGHDLFNPDANLAAARAVYDRQGWNAWTTNRLIGQDTGTALTERARQDTAMPGAAPDADQAAALAQRARQDAAMPGGTTGGTAPGPGRPMPRLTGNEAVDNANWVVWMRENDPSWTPPAAAPAPATGRGRGSAAAYKEPAPGPAIAHSASGIYQTVNGPKSLDQMKVELRKAGWGGDEGDEQAVLQAYRRTTKGAVGIDTFLQPQVQVSRWTPLITTAISGRNVPADVVLSALHLISAGLPTRAGGLLGAGAKSTDTKTNWADPATGIKAGVDRLAALYKANGNDWGRAMGAYLTEIGMTGVPDLVTRFQQLRTSVYGTPAPAVAAA